MTLDELIEWHKSEADDCGAFRNDEGYERHTATAHALAELSGLRRLLGHAVDGDLYALIDEGEPSVLAMVATELTRNTDAQLESIHA